MFQIFSKNDYLVDHLKGFVDIHNHILPGIDDGAKNVEQSIELLRTFGEFGVTHFICTPHIMTNFYDNTPKTIKESYNKLNKELGKTTDLSELSITYAAEHMIDANFETLLEKNNVLKLGKDHLLIEMSYLQASINFDTAVREILNKQLFPVFAHPERYGYLHTDFKKYSSYKKIGLKFQLNALSLFGYYGRGTQKIAHKLLHDGYYDFIATDTHGMRHLKALKETRITKKTLYSLHQLIIRTIEEFRT